MPKAGAMIRDQMDLSEFKLPDAYTSWKQKDVMIFGQFSIESWNTYSKGFLALHTDWTAHEVLN
jgi:hypothetical protein